jgi:DNA helicase TIP49 (TBP-interacting protein)
MEKVCNVPHVLREWERIAAHSHITGRDLEGLRDKPIAAGVVGQTQARGAAGVIVDMVKKGKFAGRSILLAEPPSTGKCVTADTPVHLANGETQPAEKIFDAIFAGARRKYAEVIGEMDP